jgi:hypothetical protein
MVLGFIIALAVVGGGLYIDRHVPRLVLAAIALTAVAVLMVRSHRMRHYEQAIFWLCGLFALALDFSSFLFMARLDSEKTFVPVMQAIKQNDAGHRLVGFDLSEMERGVFGFYLDRTFMNIHTVDELAHVLSSPPTPVLLIVNRNRLKDLAPILQGACRLIFEYRPGQKTRSYQLYESATLNGGSHDVDRP